MPLLPVLPPQLIYVWEEAGWENGKEGEKNIAILNYFGWKKFME
jgi:hypothetical protein